MKKRKNFLFVLLILATFLFGCGKKEVLIENDSLGEEQIEQVQQEEIEVSSIEFPCFLDDGNLEIGSLFQFAGINPDCGNSEGTEIAAIELTNHSTEYLKEGKISMLLAGETKLEFYIMDVPSGKSVMAFATDNAALSADAQCVEVNCETVYETKESDVEKKIAVSVDGITITLTNLTRKEIPECRVGCHNSLGDMFFGGTAYWYVVNELPANGSVTIDAAECFLGIAEIVRVE
jgi:hypothetical protein